jgi:hypothetical protein
MTSRANREAQRLTLSWLDDLGVKERDLQERRVWHPLATEPAPTPEPYRSPAETKRADLLRWASTHGFPQMLVRLRVRQHLIQAGESSWRYVCRTGVIEIIDQALVQSENFRVESEDTMRGAFEYLGHWRNWERFSFKPSMQQPGGHQFTLFVGDGTREAWKQFAERGSFAHIVEAVDLLEVEWVKTLLAWGESHGWPELSYCQANGEAGVILAGVESWRAYLEETDDQMRIQMSMEAQDLDEVETGREE